MRRTEPTCGAPDCNATGSGSAHDYLLLARTANRADVAVACEVVLHHGCGTTRLLLVLITRCCHQGVSINFDWF